jgi:osomolarity two-component system phosphorelay intermediate protein YPD1
MAPIDTKKADAVSGPPLRRSVHALTEHQATGPPRLSDYSKILDESTFEQILEMDDDEEDREFSRGIVYGFFEQAENTFEKIQNKM